jgi:hypothetical protein
VHTHEPVVEVVCHAVIHREVKYKELRAKETKLKKMEELIKQKEKAAQEVNNNRTKLESDGFTASLFFLYAHGLACITRWFSIYIFHTMNMALIITYYTYVAFDSFHCFITFDALL